MLEPLLPRRPVPPVNLRPARDPRPGLMAPGLLWRVAVEVLWQKGTRPDQTHLAPEHVPDLREFVKTGCPKEPSEASEPLRIRKQPPRFFPRIFHGADFKRENSRPRSPSRTCRKNTGLPIDHRIANRIGTPNTKTGPIARRHAMTSTARFVKFPPIPSYHSLPAEKTRPNSSVVSRRSTTTHAGSLKAICKPKI